MARRLTVSEVMEELDDSEFESTELEDDSSDDEFDGYVDEREMFERDDDEYDEDRLEEETAGEEGRLEQVSGVSMVEEHEEVDTAEEELEGNECRDDSEHNDRMQVGTPMIPEYVLEPGCTPALSGERPVDYFSLMVDDSMLQHIVNHTNLCADQYLTSHELAPHSRISRWKKSRHNLTELKRFLALVLIMGLIRLPQIENHWCVSWPYSSPAVSSVSKIRIWEGKHTCNDQTFTVLKSACIVYVHAFKHTSGYEARPFFPSDEVLTFE